MRNSRIITNPEVHHEKPVESLAFEQEQILRKWIVSENSYGRKPPIYTQFCENLIEKVKNPLNDFG